MTKENILLLLISILLISCSGKNGKSTDKANADTTLAATAAEAAEFDYGKLMAKLPYDFVPSNYDLYGEIWGDLNKDGIDDCVLIVRGTDLDAFVYDEYRGTLNRNRRGIIVALTTDDGENYKLIYRNESFFESDSEDGGIYFAPELSVKIERGNLIFNYSHGRYGGWKYIFRYQDNDFALIGYDSFVGSLQYTKIEYSINFLTKKMKTTIYDEREDEPDPKYPPEIQWTNIGVSYPYGISAAGSIENISEYVAYFIDEVNY